MLLFLHHPTTTTPQYSEFALFWTSFRFLRKPSGVFILNDISDMFTYLGIQFMYKTIVVVLLICVKVEIANRIEVPTLKDLPN